MTKEKKKKRKENRLSSWLLVLLMLLGIGIMAYPTVSDRWNTVHASRAIASYSSTVENTDKENKENKKNEIEIEPGEIQEGDEHREL